MYREKHHIVFKSQGGMDFEINYKHLTPEDHRGDYGPHLNVRVDEVYKIEMQAKIEKLLYKDYYSIEELTEILKLKPKQAYKAFRKLEKVKGIKREDAIFRLMGGRFYL